MTTKKTKLHAQDILCTVITELFDTNKVLIQNYPPEFHHALISQQQIGWNHIFMGHWSKSWELLHRQYTIKPGLEFMWTAKMVEISLLSMIDLWE